MVAAPERLRSIMSGGDVVLLCGAGVSVDPPAGLPDWHGLRDETLTAVAGRHPELLQYVPTLCSIEMLAVAGKRGLTPEVAASVIAGRCGGYFESFRSLEDGEPNANHRWVAAVAARGALRLMVTTNFDLFIERALEEAGVEYCSYRTEEEFATLSEPRADSAFQLLKLHGCISAPETITATVEQEAVGLGPIKIEALDRLLLGRWLVVWGYSGADLKIDIDYLRMVSRLNEARGFVWSLFADGSFHETPNQYVDRLATLYGAGRGLIGHNLLPECLDSVLPLVDRPRSAAYTAEQRLAWQAAKDERLVEALTDWAARYVDATRACLIVGELLDHSARRAEAVECFEAAERLAAANGDDRAVASALGSAAGALASLGRTAEAVFRVQRMEELARRLADPETLVWALTLRAEVDQVAGRVLEASARYREAQALARSSGNERERARLLVSLAKLERDRGNLEQAFELYGDAERIFRDRGVRHGLAEALLGKADLFGKWGENDQALAALEEAHEAELALGSRPGLAETLGLRAQVHLRLKETTEARIYAEESRGHARESGELMSEAMAVNALSAAEALDGREAEALQLAQQAVTIVRGLDHPRRLGLALHHLASIKHSLKEFDDAEQALQEALSILWTAGDWLNAALASQHLGALEGKREDLEKAQAAYQRAMALFRRAGYLHELPAVLAALSAILAEAHAEPEWVIADVVAKAAVAGGIGEAQAAALSRQLAIEPEQTLEAIARTLEADEGREAAALTLTAAISRLANRLLEEADYRAISSLTRAGFEICNAIGDAHHAGLFLNDRAYVSSKLGDVDLASGLLAQAIDYAAWLADADELALRWGNLAGVYQSAGRPQEASEALARGERAAATIVDDEQRTARFFQLAHAYEALRAWEGAGRCFTETMQPASANGDLAALARARQGRGKALRELGEHAKAAREREVASTLYAASGDEAAAAIMACLAGIGHEQELGRPTEARRLYELAIGLGERAGAAEMVAEARSRLAKL